MPRPRRNFYGDTEDPFAVPTPDYAMPSGPTSTYTAPGYQTGATGRPQTSTYPGQLPDVVDTLNSGSAAPRGTPLGLEGFEASKLNQQHALSSPKYAFGMTFQGAAPEEFGKRFELLRQQFPSLFSGWSLNGDRLAFDPTKGQLNSAWNGVTGVDIARNFTGEGSKGLQWLTDPVPGQSGVSATFTPQGGPGPFGAPSSGTGQYDRPASNGFGSSPGAPLSGPANVAGAQQVGGDPFSQMIESGFSNFLNWSGANNPSAQGSAQGILSLIGNQGQLDPRVTQRNLETLREQGDTLRRSQVNTLKGELANRGLLAEPGYGSGPERTGLERIESQDIAPLYAQGFRDIGTSELQNASNRYMQALGLGAQQGSNQANTFLSGLEAGTNRQGVLSDIALRSLGQNMEWSKFLASYGLERDKVMNDIMQGRLDQYLPLINMFLQFAQTANRGYIG